MPQLNDPVVVVHLFSRPPEAVDTFLERWPSIFSPATQAPGFRDSTLHRAISPDAPFPLINIAHWDSTEAWEAAHAKYFSRFVNHGSDAAQTGSYQVVHVAAAPDGED